MLRAVLRVVPKPEEVKPPPAKATGDAAAYASLQGEVPQQLLDDWRAVRKGKKAVLTQTAIEGLRREARKAGLTLEQVIRLCCEHSWQGFNANWKFERPADAGPAETPRERAARQRVHVMTGGLASSKPQGEVLDGYTREVD